MALPKPNSTRKIDWNALQLTPTPAPAPRTLNMAPAAPAAPYTPPPAPTMQTQTPVQNAPQAAPQPGFNEALQALLKEYQQLGTKPFVEKGIKAQEAQNARISAPSDMIGAAPGVQSAARSASASALEPTISGTRSSAQTFSEQLGSFKDAVDSARSFMQQREEKTRADREEARNNILMALELGGAEGLEAIDSEMGDLFKIAGLDKETLIASAKAKQQFERALASQKSGGGGTSSVADQYASERRTRILQSVDDLIGRVSSGTSGIGSISAIFPGTPARNFKADLETLKANISFSELQEMRNASKTGGALGQVAIRELELLESTLGSLDQGQSPGNLKGNLEKIRGSIERWETAKAGGTGTTAASGADPLGIR